MKQPGRRWIAAVALGALLSSQVGAPLASVAPHDPDSNDVHTTTPITHVIVLIGENRTFDHVYGT